MPNILEIKHGNAVPVDGDLEPYELGYCDSNGFLYIGKQSEEGEKKTEEIKLPTNYYTILYGSDNYIISPTDAAYSNLVSSKNRDGVIATTDASTLGNFPINSGPFYAYKKTFLQKNKDDSPNAYNIFNILFEMYPVPGRIWTNAFSFEDNEQGQWGAWKAASFLNYDSFDNYNLSLGYTETANKEPSISMYRKDANGILKLGRFYMADYSGTSSLSVLQVSAKDGNGKSAITLRMNWSGDDFRLLTPTSQTGSSYIGDSANPWTGVYALSYNSGDWNGNTIPIARGGTGATTAGAARANLGAAASNHTHFYLQTEGDYRDYNTTPNDYYNNFVFRGIKTQNAIGTPAGSYAYLMGLRGWSDSSGGDSHELAFVNAGVYHRMGATTSWGSWAKLYTSRDTIPIVNGGTGAASTVGARSNLKVPAEIDIEDGVSGFPFSYGSVVSRGYLGNTIGQATVDNYYWGVDSLANLWAGKQTNRATSPTWKRAMMMDSEQKWTTLYSGTLTSGSATVTNGGKYAAWIIGAIPSSGEDLVMQCIPGGNFSSAQITSNNHWISYKTSVPHGGNGTITVISNPFGGAIKYIWGILRYFV